MAIIEKKKTCYKVTQVYKNKKYVRFFKSGDLNVDHHDAVVFAKSIDANNGIETEYLFNQYGSIQTKLIPIKMKFE